MHMSKLFSNLSAVYCTLVIVFGAKLARSESQSTLESLAPVPCLTSSFTNLLQLIDCFDQYTVPSGAYTNQASYDIAQPNPPLELPAWNTAINSLLNVNSNCGPALLPPALTGSYTITLFQDSDRGGNSFCILSETTLALGGRYYRRGWGLMVVPATRAAVSRNIHISAPHPGDNVISDAGTPSLAASVFQKTGAKSLFISGRHKDAFTRASACIGGKSTTDAAYDPNEPFFKANKVIRSWQGECPSASCAFIQLYRQTSCPADTVFLSAGIGDSPNTIFWYFTTFNSPVRRIKNQLDDIYSTVNNWKNSLPSTSQCTSLAATQNVFGRLLNRVNEGSLCSSASTLGTVTGQFVNVEHTDVALMSPGYRIDFPAAINRALCTSCDIGMYMDTLSLLCV